MVQGQFEPECPICRAPCLSLKTTEDTPFSASSFYGLTKQVQEQTVLLMSQTLGMDGVALRYQNVYGPGQSLSNPYTGILAIFSGLARRGLPIHIFEDGLESRDFVFIDDVTTATVMALRAEVKGIHSINVGSGIPTTIMEVARRVIDRFEARSEIQVTGEFRLGDIRHNVADLDRARQVLGYSPSTSFEAGLSRFLDWAIENVSDVSGYEQSLRELQDRKLMNA
jgi:dTDP-L-rhamnose 4-epimerase